jgi:PAB1-binding protein PBP1
MPGKKVAKRKLTGKKVAKRKSTNKKVAKRKSTNKKVAKRKLTGKRKMSRKQSSRRKSSGRKSSGKKSLRKSTKRKSSKKNMKGGFCITDMGCLKGMLKTLKYTETQIKEFEKTYKIASIKAKVIANSKNNAEVNSAISEIRNLGASNPLIKDMIPKLINAINETHQNMGMIRAELFWKDVFITLSMLKKYAV